MMAQQQNQGADNNLPSLLNKFNDPHHGANRQQDDGNVLVQSNLEA